MSATTYFGLDGKGLPSEKMAVCSITSKSNGEAVYQVARINSGVEAGFFVNPQSLYYTENLMTAYDVEKGKPYIALSKVNKEVFDYYLKFLQTQNLVYLRGAERECL